MLPATGLTAAMECTRTVLFPGGIRRLESFRINTLKIEKFRPPLATHCWAVSCQQPSIQQWWGTACSAGPALQTVPCHCWFESWGKDIETVKVHAIFQLFEKITYVILTYNTALLPSLLTIFVRVRKEQYHRLFSCYTTATSRAPVLQQWRLNSWTLDFWNHCWWRYPTARRHDNRRIVYYPPQVSPSAMECTRTVLFPGGIRRLVSFRINTLKIEKFRPPLATHCWAVSCKQEFNPAVVGHSL